MQVQLLLAAEERTLAKYTSLDLVAIETLGVIGPNSMAFIKDLGHRIRQRTGEVKSLAYLLQQLSVAVQKENPFPFRNPLVDSVHTYILRRHIYYY